LAAARAAATGHATPATLSAGLSEAPAASIDQGNLRLEIGRDLLTAPRRRAERAVAEVAVRAAEISLSVEERRRDAALLRDLLRAAGARRIAERLAAEDLVLLGAADGVRERFAVGQARYVDVLRVRTERLRVQVERSRALADARVAAAALMAPLRSESTRSTVQAAIDSLAADQSDAWRVVLPPALTLDSLLAVNERVLLGEVEAERARRERALLVAEQRVQVSAYAGVQRVGQANNGPTFGPSLGFSMTLPFTAARGNRLAVGAAEQRIVSVGTTQFATLAEVRGRLQAGLARYAEARLRLETMDAALLRGAREERESALAAYRTGSVSLLELLDFERALARAEIERVHAVLEAADAWADLMGATEPSAALSLPGGEAP
jgi:outer membrane protein TolC